MITKNYHYSKTPLHFMLGLEEEVDVLVIGGGPAGLLAASRLASRHRVALIERGPLGTTTKYWVTTERRLQNHDLADCILHKPLGMTAGTFLGGHLRTIGDFAVVDDRLLMKVLVERCRNQKVQLVEQCALLNLQWAEQRIKVQATAKSYSTRVLIDATGGHSPIATTFRLHRLYGFFTVYGALLRRIKLKTSDIVLAHIGRLGDPPPILEVIPCGEDSAYCSIFLYTKQLTPPGSMATAFKDHCSHNDFFDTSENTQFESAKIGSIPIGKIRRRQLPGVVLVGEAALVQPPLLGTAFNEVLEYSDSFCAHVSTVLSRRAVVPLKPKFRYPTLKRIQDYIQLQLMRSLLNNNVETFDRLIRFMSRLPAETIFAFCSNEMDWRQLLNTAARLPLYFGRATQS